MYRRLFLAILPMMGVALAQSPPRSNPLPNRPKVPGTLSLRTRRRVEQPAGSGRFAASEEVLRWEAAQTAIVIIDMWDTHTCANAAQRVGAMAPGMNQVVDAARRLGVMIIHAPSDTMKFYEGSPQRLRMQQAPKAPSPFPVRATEPDQRVWPPRRAGSHGSVSFRDRRPSVLRRQRAG